MNKYAVAVLSYNDLGEGILTAHSLATTAKYNEVWQIIYNWFKDTFPNQAFDSMSYVEIPDSVIKA